MKKAKRFKPVEGKVYKNRGGGTFRCTGCVHETPYTIAETYSAIMVNVASGWEFMAHGLLLYPDGTIEWDFSTDGHFVEVVS